jgi:hypothetical protein
MPGTPEVVNALAGMWIASELIDVRPGKILVDGRFECHGCSMKIVGKIERSNLEGGQWILHTAKGERYQLTGAVAELRDGMHAEVTGSVDRNMMGFGMGGANFVATAVVEKAAPSKAKHKK